MRRVLLVTLLLVVVAAQAAHAGTVSLGSVATDPKYGYQDAVLFFGATPGERNRIVVAKVDSNRPPTLVLRDEGARFRPGGAARRSTPTPPAASPTTCPSTRATATTQ